MGKGNRGKVKNFFRIKNIAGSFTFGEYDMENFEILF